MPTLWLVVARYAATQICRLRLSLVFTQSGMGSGRYSRVHNVHVMEASAAQARRWVIQHESSGPQRPISATEIATPRSVRHLRALH